MAAARAVQNRLHRHVGRWGAVAHTPTPIAPVIDGTSLPAPPWAAFAAGAARDVELLIGHCRDEYSLIAAQLPDISDADVDPLIEQLDPTPGARRYRSAFTTIAANELREIALSDWLVRMPTLHLAEAADCGRAKVWLYELCRGFGPHGASHGLDALLVFGTTDVHGQVTAAGPAALAEVEQLSRAMRAEHLAFATTGNPGWARFHHRDRRTRVYDPGPGVVRYPEERSRTIWHDRRFGALDLPC